VAETLKKIVGFDLPSYSPLFLSVLSFHILFGIACVLLGIVAMLSKKRRGEHPKFGTAYYWFLALLFASAMVLAVMRWSEDYPLIILGALSFLAATVGRIARRQLWRRWIDFHVTGMGLSYILMLTAFYVDNGKNLPVWRDLPYLAYWVLPGAVGIPLIVSALIRWHRQLGGNTSLAVSQTRSGVTDMSAKCLEAESSDCSKV
jgi:hypothetical protein